MKKLIPFLMVGVLLIGGCATKPKTPEPEPKPEPTITQAQVDQLLSEASALRKKAFDLKLFEVVADDYKAADNLYVTGKTAYDSGDLVAAEPALTNAITAFKDVIAKGSSILAEENRQKADDMKALAMKAGAEDSAAEWLAQGDKEYAAAVALADADKDDEALLSFEAARKTYEAAYKKANATNLRASIEERDFAQYDSGNFQLADDKLAEAGSLFAANPDGAIDALDEATLRYNLVIQKGWQSYALGRKAPADDAKKRSEDIKAQVAVKNQYAEALAAYDGASALMAGGNYEEAGAEFDRSAGLFEQAYAAAEAKRNAALEAIQAMEEKTADSESKAIAGDEIIGSEAE